MTGVRPPERLGADNARWRHSHDGVAVGGDLDLESPRLLIQVELPLRSGRGGRYPPCRSGERHPPNDGAAVAVLAAQTIESGRGGQVAGAVIEELAGKRTRLDPVGRLAGSEPGGRLNHAVEPTTSRPRTVMTPGVDDHDNRTWVALGDLLGREPKAVQGARPIAMYQDVGLAQESV